MKVYETLSLFVDGVLVAEVVKRALPRLIDLHNYSPANATSNKMQNWFLLNNKVFKQLRFELSEDIIRSLVNGKIGLIERVLTLLRSRLERLKCTSKKDVQKAYDSDRSQGNRNVNHTAQQEIVKLKKTSSSNVVPGAPGWPNRLSNEMVPLPVLEEKEQEVLTKNETIQILQAKIKRLEHLLHLKDIRIDDLSQRLECQRAAGKR